MITSSAAKQFADEIYNQAKDVLQLHSLLLQTTNSGPDQTTFHGKQWTVQHRTKMRTYDMSPLDLGTSH